MTALSTYIRYAYSRRAAWSAARSGFLFRVLVGADRLVRHCEEYRACWITGALGAGKTALGVALLAEFYLRGWNCYANIPLSFLASPAPGPGELIPPRSAILLDEASDWLDAYDWRSSLVRRFRYLRHRDLVVLMPSADPIHRRLRKFSVWVRRIRLPGGFVYICRGWTDAEISPPAPRSRRQSSSFIFFVDSVVHAYYPDRLSGVTRYDDQILESLMLSLDSFLRSGPREEWGYD